MLDSQASYNPTFDFGISLASNSLYGMNTSQDDAEAQTDGEFSAIVACWVRYQILSHTAASLSRGNQHATRKMES
eukprot:COSAG01_NODE_1401_length_10450_cov_100.148198_7_plen_75_part_00